MGFTRFRGPVYGAKSLLLSASRDLAAGADASSYVTLASALVPVSEDWLLTELQVWRGSTQSTLFAARVLDDSTVVSSVAITSSAAGVLGRWLSTAAGGEDEGIVVAAESSLTLEATPGSSGIASSGVTVNLYGYIRFVSSSRFAG